MPIAALSTCDCVRPAGQQNATVVRDCPCNRRAAPARSPQICCQRIRGSWFNRSPGACPADVGLVNGGAVTLPRGLGHTSHAFCTGNLLTVCNQLIQGQPACPEAHVLAMPSANVPLDLPL